MHLIADTVHVHAFERVLQILRESVDGGLIFALLPSLELPLLVDALDVRDEVASVALVDDAVARGGAERVHVASLPVRVDIAEGLPSANDADFDFFDRLLVIPGAVPVLKVGPQVDVLGEEELHGHVEIAACVPGFMRDYAKLLVLLLTEFATATPLVRLIVLGPEQHGLLVVLLHPQDACLVVVEDRA